MKNKIIIPFLLILFIGYSSAQDIHFSNIDLSPLTVNPAMAGSTEKAQGIAQYRTQWNSIGAPFQTIAATGEMRIKEDSPNSNGFFAIGLNLFNDQIGEPKIITNAAAFTAAYHIKVNEKNYVGLGMNAGFSQRSIEDGNGQWGSQYDGTQYNSDLPSGEIFNNASFSFFTTGAGLVYSYNANESRKIRLNESFSFRSGFGAYHLNKPIYSFFGDTDERLLMRFSGFTQASFVFGGTMMGFDPAIYYQQQGPSREIFLGGDYKFFFQEASKFTGFIERNSLAAGLYYRVGDAFVARTILQFSNYSIGFSYDFNASRLTEVTRGRGGAELFFRWRM